MLIYFIYCIYYKYSTCHDNNSNDETIKQYATIALTTNHIETPPCGCRCNNTILRRGISLWLIQINTGQ